MRQVSGQYVIHVLDPIHDGGGDFFWVSGANKAVRVSGGLVRVPLPESFVAAYLAVLPSDLQSFQFDEAHERQWIRNEIDRRFYYVDKALQRLAPVQDKEARLPDTDFIEQSMTKIVELRRQYFGGPTEEEWALATYDRLVQRSPGVSPDALFTQEQLQERVHDLKTWWNAHRNDAAALLTPTPPP